MFKSIRFQNFKVLRDTELPLGPFTLIVGPNGSGKSTALIGLRRLAYHDGIDYGICRSAPPASSSPNAIKITASWDSVAPDELTEGLWDTNGDCRRCHRRGGKEIGAKSIEPSHPFHQLRNLRFFTLDAEKLAQSYPLQAAAELGPNGEWFPVVLHQLQNEHPERFEKLREEFTDWLPEFDTITFSTPTSCTGQVRVVLRTRIGKHRVPAGELSQGTLLALAILTLAYLSEPPPLVAFEEPDRGLHPRLLQDIRDALYRLAYPEGFGESRAPVQVIATTHNPYFLNLFREHPEEIVIAEKTETEATFKRLVEMPYMDEILDGADLGEIWYSGILGGVPSRP